MSKPSDEESKAFKRITHQEQPYIHDIDENTHLEHRSALNFGCPCAMTLTVFTVLLWSGIIGGWNLL